MVICNFNVRLEEICALGPFPSHHWPETLNLQTVLVIEREEKTDLIIFDLKGIFVYINQAIIQYPDKPFPGPR